MAWIVYTQRHLKYTVCQMALGTMEKSNTGIRMDKDAGMWVLLQKGNQGRLR